MGLASGQIGEDEFFARTPEFEPLEGLRNPESDTKRPKRFDVCCEVVKKNSYALRQQHVCTSSSTYMLELLD